MNNIVSGFLDSNLDEAEYFSLSKENLMYLRDFLEILKSKEEEFKNSIKTEEESIKHKCKWVDHVEFSGVQISNSNELFLSSIKLEGKNTSLETFYNEGNKKYITCPRFIPKFICLTKWAKNKRATIESIKDIQEELLDIDNIGKDIFSGYLNTKSASGKFGIDFIPFEGAILNNKYTTLAFYGDNKPEYVEEKLDSLNKEEILNRILIKK